MNDDRRARPTPPPTTLPGGTPYSPSVPVTDSEIYHEALEMLRSQHSAFVTESTALIVVLATLVGFAIDRQSYGIAIVALAAEPGKLMLLRHWRNSATALVAVARSHEPEVGPSLAGALMDNSEFVHRTWHRRITWVVLAVHGAVAMWLAFSTGGWSFAGS